MRKFWYFYSTKIWLPVGFCTKQFNSWQIILESARNFYAPCLHLHCWNTITINTYCSNSGTYHGDLCNPSTYQQCLRPGDPTQKTSSFWKWTVKCLQWCWETKLSHKFFDMKAKVLVIFAKKSSCKWYDDTFTYHLEQGGVQCVMKIYTRNT